MSHGTPRVPPVVAVSVPSGTTPEPQNFVIDATPYLASQELPAAGAFTTTQTKAVPLGTKRVTFWVTYTRGAAGGYPLFRPYFFGGSGGTVQGRLAVLDLSSFAAAAPEGTTNFYLETLRGPAPADDLAIRFQLTFELPAYASFIDLFCAEGGAVGTPGTIEVDYTGQG